VTEQAKDDKAATGDEMKTVSDEIDAAVDGVVEAAKAEREAETENTDRQEQSDGSADGVDTESKDGEIAPNESDESTDESKPDGSKADASKADADAVTDEHIERAVKAGLSMAEARQFGSASLLDTMVSKLEAGKTAASDDGKPADESAESTDEDPLAAIPDLDPEEYDEGIVKGFAAMKGLIKSLQAGQSATSVDWFDSQVSGLDEAVSTAITSDPAKLKGVRDKLSVLEAGYKAAGQDVPRDTIFQEAVRIAMGDAIAQSAVDAKAGKLGKRSTQHINRPAGHRATPKGDVLEEVGAEIDAKFSNKT